MDYSQLSDFEINVEVFEALHGGSPDYKESDNGEMLLVSFEAEVVGGDIVEVEVVRGSFNPCHNPSDAWPIISANRISVEYDSWHHEEWVTAYGIDELKAHVVSHQPCDKALRSAMIAFLMMQGSNHD